MRSVWTVTVLLSVVTACREVEPVREISVREARHATLDSLARQSECDSARYALLYDPAAWRPVHACAVAHRALELLASAAANEPYFAPRDTARVRAVAIVRRQPCILSMANDRIVGGKLAPLVYLIEIEASDRAHSIQVGLDAERMTGQVAFDEHPRGTMSPFLHLTIPTGNSPDSLANGAPC